MSRMCYHYFVDFLCFLISSLIKEEMENLNSPNDKVFRFFIVEKSISSFIKYCQRIRQMLCCPCYLVPENIECNLGLIPLANQSLQLVNKTLRPRFKGREYSPSLSMEEVSKNSQICFKCTTFSLLIAGSISYLCLSFSFYLSQTHHKQSHSYSQTCI